jgi:Family of unknown function (DUF5686)/CarboxypepD_reg-like domain
MQQKGSKIKTGVLLLWIMIAGYAGRGQDIVLHGLVRDSATRASLSNASIAVKGLKGGARTKADGRFRIPVSQHTVDLVISSVGYNTRTLHLDSVPQQEVVISLSPQFRELRNVTVVNKKQKYRNKDNPAVELIRKVIENKEKNRMEAFTYASYEKYEKLQASIDKATDTKAAKTKLLKPYHFLVENGDTSKMEGRTLSPVYLEETLSDVYFRRNPEKTKTIVLGKKKVDFGEAFDMRGISSFLNRLYQDFNVYDNNIDVFTNVFLSPIADAGPAFYMYFIDDTVMLDSQKLVRLSFRPRNPNDFLFRGTMWITLDGNYAIQKLRLLVSKSINMNLVRELKIDQDFEKMPNGRFLLDKSDVLADFGLSPKGLGIFGERTVSYKKFTIGQPIPDSLFKGSPLVMPDSAESHPDSFWVSARHDTLTRAESKVYANIDSLQHMKSYRRLMDWGTLLLAGYKQAGPFEIGPASTFYSFNPVEGFRLRFGGRTTTRLSTRYYSEAYAAYGFGDQKWKYFLSGTYSLNNKSIYSYPQQYIRASYQKDTKIPGEELQFVQEDNFLLSFKRGPNDKWLYNDIFRLQYLKEFGNHFSYNIGFKYWQQSPAGSIAYVKSDINGADTLSTITTTEGSLELRWAPNEQFYIGKLYRTPIFNKYPILDFRYIVGIKGLFGGQYNYHNLDLNVFKRFYESQLGYTDVTADFGYLIGKVPFALAYIAHANQTYAYQLQSYNMMNFLEFVSDHYATVYVDHYFNGFFFNKVPLLKKLKWREVIEAKVLYGGLRNENNPAKNPEQVQFPLTNGQLETFALNRTPYVEAGFAIANIFKLIRIDFIKRFTYLNNPDIPKYGIRFRAHFDF